MIKQLKVATADDRNAIYGVALTQMFHPFKSGNLREKSMKGMSSRHPKSTMPKLNSLLRGFSPGKRKAATITPQVSMNSPKATSLGKMR